MSSLIAASFLGEPLQTVKSAVRKFNGWKAPLKKEGFLDISQEKELLLFEKRIKSSESITVRPPVLLLHGMYSSPDIWIPWSKRLAKAKRQRQIGQILTLQLPDNFEERMKIVYRVINQVTQILKNAHFPEKIDLIGHSLGGFAAHLAAYKPESILIKDHLNRERRWHAIGPECRNEKVRKVITLASPTWLCCMGHCDESSMSSDIYPSNIFTKKAIAEAYTKEQIETIHQNHENIYDLTATQDAIAATVSPLPETQVFAFQSGHLGIVSAGAACQIVLNLLND